MLAANTVIKVVKIIEFCKFLTFKFKLIISRYFIKIINTNICPALSAPNSANL